METYKHRFDNTGVSERQRGGRMQWASAMVERGAGHCVSTEDGCPGPCGEVTEGGYSSCSLFSELSTHIGQF